jgi:DNA invertase Pin-like site-specific DNA recombinase
MKNLIPPASGVWDADVYLRLSKEDKDKKDESNSIKNQRDLILDFVGQNPDIRVAHILADDGATGANFNRDDFQDMISHIESGAVNCVIVKDFSRLGRDHIGTGKYIERYFASKNVRLISINDHYDSLRADMRDMGNSLIVPFKNIINEAFLEDISTKTKSQLAIKRKNGELVCNYAVYGYVKAGKALAVDEYAADVVRAIFESRIMGYSESRIAALLNDKGELSPAEYKKSRGERYSTPFAKRDKPSLWTPNAVRRVLTNRVYLGHLEQGKRTKASYRVTKFFYKPREAWSVHENAHEAIVTEADFELVRDLMARDTRVSSGAGTPHIFSGFVVCGHCGQPMILKTVKKNGNQYTYFICATHKKDGSCRYNSVSDKAVEKFALLAVRRQIAAFLSADGIDGAFGADALQSRKAAAIEGLIDRALRTIKENNEYIVKSYEHFVAGVVTEAEYSMFRGSFRQQIENAERNIARLRAELERLNGGAGVRELVERFKAYENITELDRRAVAGLIHSVIVNDSKDMEIRFRYAGGSMDCRSVPSDDDCHPGVTEGMVV